jgi:hypothetical protein
VKDEEDAYAHLKILNSTARNASMPSSYSLRMTSAPLMGFGDDLQNESIIAKTESVHSKIIVQLPLKE